MDDQTLFRALRDATSMHWALLMLEHLTAASLALDSPKPIPFVVFDGCAPLGWVGLLPIKEGHRRCMGFKLAVSPQRGHKLLVLASL